MKENTYTGTIIKIFPKGGFGFVGMKDQEGNEKTYYFHASNLIRETLFDSLRIGDVLKFEQIVSKEDSYSGKGESIDKVYK